MRRLKQILDAGKTVVSGWCGITDSRYLETIAEYDFDAVVLDMQHGFFDETSIQDAIATLVARGKAPLVRIPLARWDTASRVMDFGALAVIAPMINNADDARAFVSATRFVPVGNRSFGPRHAASLYAVDTNQYLKEFDQCSLALAMIETREAYDNLGEIIGVEGIDGVLIGPGDLSISFRQNPIPDAYGVDTLDVVKDIVARCKRAGKKTAAFTIDSETANMVNGLGVDIISVGLDVSYIADGVNSHLSDLDFR
ncbi:MAG: 2,4-dihydroxyhept-2-ene-1,7-dioic acid aldolase [Gammaproteobacteria bacterium]|nr:2,4-dihydroxyhept-2-ene-1,7-dioic acid aldolase [Gammaproteobacteria bacterium]